MVEVGIPVYHAQDTLPAALDSLVAQTKKNFIVCISIDGDTYDYTPIINTYKERGLKIRVINSPDNRGAGVARQRILDTTQCDYIMFLDADDLYMPRTVEKLYSSAKLNNFDLVRSNFIREFSNGTDIVLDSNANTTTWFHGKIYKVAYLKEKNINFLPELRTDEDAYFNLVACNSTNNRGTIDEVLYIWKDNRESVTRNRPRRQYFLETHMNYIHGQVEGLKKVFEINQQIATSLITFTLLNIYYYYMDGRFYHCDEAEMDRELNKLRNYEWIQAWARSGDNWKEVISNVKPGKIHEEPEGTFVTFYEEPFNKWAVRLFLDKV